MARSRAWSYQTPALRAAIEGEDTRRLTLLIDVSPTSDVLWGAGFENPFLPWHLLAIILENASLFQAKVLVALDTFQWLGHYLGTNVP